MYTFFKLQTTINGYFFLSEITFYKVNTMKEGFVYLLVDFGSEPEKYKIGITTGRIDKRIKSLQTGNPNEINVLKYFKSKFYRHIEKSLHKKYNYLKTNGGNEWFTLPPDSVFDFMSDCESIHNQIDHLVKMGNPFIIS